MCFTHPVVEFAAGLLKNTTCIPSPCVSITLSDLHHSLGWIQAWVLATSPLRLASFSFRVIIFTFLLLFILHKPFYIIGPTGKNNPSLHVNLKVHATEKYVFFFR